jgi:hypothetical protein
VFTVLRVSVIPHMHDALFVLSAIEVVHLCCCFMLPIINNIIITIITITITIVTITIILQASRRPGAAAAAGVGGRGMCVSMCESVWVCVCVYVLLLVCARVRVGVVSCVFPSTSIQMQVVHAVGLRQRFLHSFFG